MSSDIKIGEKQNFPQERVFGYRIFGDSIHECLKVSELIRESAPSMGLELIRIHADLTAPTFCFKANGQLGELSSKVLAFQVCGRYGDWSRECRPVIGYEDPDVIMTFVSTGNDAGEPIVALEFNNAIPAGNNAWQRFPRIAQAAEKKVPFLYTIPACDAEVKDGVIKSIRHPNTVINLAQLVLMDYFQVPSLTIYEESVWYSHGLVKGRALESIDGCHSRRRIGRFLVLQALYVALMRSFGQKSGITKWLEDEQQHLLTEIFRDMLVASSHFVGTDFTILRRHPLLLQANRDDVINCYLRRLSTGADIHDKYRFYLWKNIRTLDNVQKFGKVVTTKSIFRDKLNSRLYHECDAVSYKKPANEIAFVYDTKAFAEALAQSYPSLESTIIERCRAAIGPLLFLPIAGYVEDSGGVIAFSRPDKGLVGLIATIFGKSPTFAERVVLMYHQEIPSTWKNELETAIQEYEGHKVHREPNNLWREVARFATIVIVDRFGQGWVRH